ncbi:MAG TPA: lanthionine synthetase LanC family protein [Kofleriaceae bacterium]|jgi:hypothetical protein
MKVPPATAWQPLLAGRDAELAREAIEAVALDLERLAPGDPSLYHGQAGIALLHGYRARDGDERAVDAAGDALAIAVAGRGEEQLPWLGRGFAGAAFALAHLRDVIDAGPDALGELDKAIAWVLERDPWPFDWELIGGLIGLGVYGLERDDSAMVERVLGHLTARAERGPDGTTWLAPARERDMTGLPTDETYDNLGLPYGVAGAVGFLAAARSANLTGPDPSLLEQATRWLRGRDRPDEPIEGIRLPAFIAGGRRQNPRNRNGWCYGDPITAVALVGAGLAAGETSFIDHGLELALHAARWSVRAGPAEADGLSFCHGAAGRAHIFNRLAQATGSAELCEAARASYRRLLSARHPGSGIGGFRFDTSGGRFDHGIQLGAAGVAMCLLAGVSDVPPDWDRAFLTALPPRA